MAWVSKNHCSGCADKAIAKSSRLINSVCIELHHWVGTEPHPYEFFVIVITLLAELGSRLSKDHTSAGEALYVSPDRDFVITLGVPIGQLQSHQD
jgi:hypothetical protein